MLPSYSLSLFHTQLKLFLFLEIMVAMKTYFPWGSRDFVSLVGNSWGQISSEGNGLSERWGTVDQCLSCLPVV